MHLRGRHFETNIPLEIELSGERIRSVQELPASPETDTWPLVAPGLFDLQINGHGGSWFSNPDLRDDQIPGILEPFFAHGITRLCPTLITSSYESLARGFAAIRAACEQVPWVNRMVPGCHLEGPYISPEDGPRGAHPRTQVRGADWNEFSKLQELSGGRIRLVTLAPESPGAVEFIRQAISSEVRISIGHTNATADQIEAAVDAGAVLSTHLGNGIHPLLRRHPNPIWDQLGEPRLSASLISDGHHVPPSFLRAVVAAKGVDKIIITCDASGFAGCQPGTYPTEAGDVELLPSGKIVMAANPQLLAGSGSFTEECVAEMVAARAATLPQAWHMATRNPARLLGFETVDLRPGARADLVLIASQPQGKLRVLTTVADGQVRYATALNSVKS
ncbi:MAG: amidohydrolase family protein [Planctomycetales bacterium]